MSPSLDFNQYGKTQVRLTQVLGDGAKHEVVELTVKILFQGDFADSYEKADNSRVLPTDTMKNTVYVLARQHPIESIEGFGLLLARHFLAQVTHLEKVEIEIEQRPWSRIDNHASSFFVDGQHSRFTNLIGTRDSEQIVSGFRNLEILKTSDSAFSGYLKDDLTTLPETRDRLLGTVLDADWTYRRSDLDFNEHFERTRIALLDSFSKHVSESVQHTLYDMAVAALRCSDELSEVHLVMPNKHRLLVNLERFGLDNPNQIFVPTDEPSGFIEARVRA